MSSEESLKKERRRNVMKKYVFNEVKGKYQGEMIIVEAETADEACEKAGMKEKIKPCEKFDTFYLSKMYELYEMDKPFAVEYVCHK